MKTVSSKAHSIPKAISDRITAQRSLWAQSRASGVALENLNKEIATKMDELSTDSVSTSDINAIAKHRAEKTALRMEYLPLAEEQRKKAEERASIDMESAKHGMRQNVAGSLNDAVAAVRESRVNRRSTLICSDILKWATGSNDATGTITPALDRVLRTHFLRNNINLEERYINRGAQPNESATEFIRLLSEADPAVREVDNLPTLGGPADHVSEEEFEAVAKFLEALPAEDAA